MDGLISTYQLRLPPLSLIQISMIKIATHLWKHPTIKSKIQELSRPKKLALHPQLSPEQKNTFNRVLEKIDQLRHLPAGQKSDLKFVAVQIGVGVFQWLAKIDDDNRKNLIDNIQWDRAGCVDAAETYRSLYHSGKIRKDTPKRLKAIHSYCLEDLISDYWCEVPRHERGAQLQQLYPHDSEAGVLLYWTQYINGLSVGAPVQKQPKTTGVTPVVLRGTVRPPYQAFKYFWNRSTEEQRVIIIGELEQFVYTDKNLEGLATCTESLNFLMKRLVDAGRDEFCRKNSEYLDRIIVNVLLHWPWHNLFVPVIQGYLDSNPQLYYYTLFVINKQAYVDYQILGDTQRYHDLTLDLWRVTPQSVKRALKHRSFALRVADILVKKIFDDEDLATIRQELFTPTSHEWIMVRRELFDKYPEIFDDFFKRILRMTEERERLRSAPQSNLPPLIEAAPPAIGFPL